MIKNNEVTLNDSEEETTTAAPVFVGFDEEFLNKNGRLLQSSEFEVISLDSEFIEEAMESLPFL